ncbi:MAG: surface carbohydrate biosynthesis protein [Promethearchaeota archaeon]
MKIANKKWLYIAIETKSREYIAKLFLSILALEKGYNVVLGRRNIRLLTKFSSMPPGIYLDKSIWDIQYNTFKKLKKSGYYVCSTDEEGLVYRTPDNYLERVSLKCLKLLNLFFVWGQDQANIISNKYPQIANKIKIVGNPRIDILKRKYFDIYEKESNYIKKKYGKFILVNSNFPHATTETLSGTIKELKSFTYNVDENYWKNSFEYQSKLIKLFIEGIKELAKSTSLFIVIRPHPSEDPNYWIEGFKDYDNVKIVYKFSVNPWIIESEVVIHNGCTTGIEAFLMKKPVIAYRPIYSDQYDQELPNSISKELNNKVELIKWVKIFLKNKNKFNEIYDEKIKLMKKHVSLINDLSSLEILNHLNSLNANSYSFEISFLKKFILGIYVSLRKFVVNLDISILHINKIKKQKFPGIDKKELKNDARNIKDILNFQKDINILEVLPNQFILSTDLAEN